MTKTVPPIKQRIPYDSHHIYACSYKGVNAPCSSNALERHLTSRDAFLLNSRDAGNNSGQTY